MSDRISTALKAKIHEWLDGSYRIGLIEGGYGVLNQCSAQLPPINWVKGVPKGSWLADPFILSVDEDSVTLLVEEYRFQNTKGRLAKVEIDTRTMMITHIATILDREFHLSFPYILRGEDKTFIIPESCANSHVAIYELTGDGLKGGKTIIDGPMLDTQLFQLESKYYAFTVRHTAEGMAETKRLLVLESDTLQGPFSFIQSIENDRCEERGAGAIFECEGKIIRPAQICENGYGKGLVFYEIVLDNGKFQEKELRRFYPEQKKRNGLCLHTFNACGNWAVVDGFDYKVRWLAKISPFFYKLKSIYNELRY